VSPETRDPAEGPKPALPLALKVAYTLLFLVWFPTWWVEHGLANFLWFSNIATIVLFFALWTEHRLALSTMAVAVIVPEVFWNVDFLLQLLTPFDGFGLADYMFADETPWHVFALSGAAHVTLPILLLYCVRRLGHDRRALRAQILLAWIVLPLVHFTTDPADNINWTRGLGEQPQDALSPLLYLALVMVIMPVFVYAPSHWALKKWGRA
jgi:hypothetical protein